MEAMRSEHPIMEMADALEVSASGYAEHLKKDERPRRREDQKLGEKLTAIFKPSHSCGEAAPIPSTAMYFD